MLWSLKQQQLVWNERDTHLTVGNGSDKQYGKPNYFQQEIQQNLFNNPQRGNSTIKGKKTSLSQN